MTLRLLFLLSIVFGIASSAAGQRGFQGDWEWATYATSRSELPPAYREARLKEIPQAAIYLKLRQHGNKLTGDYSASRRFLARLEDGELESVVKRGKTTVQLTSGFGGNITAVLTLSGSRLHWKMVKSDGEHYFPDDVFLHRIRPRKRVNVEDQ